MSEPAEIGLADVDWLAQLAGPDLPSAENKHGYGFHPLGAWCDTTGEPLALMLRPGNAGSNDADDHLELLDQTIGSLPVEYQVGHQPGDEPGLVRHHILVRAD